MIKYSSLFFSQAVWKHFKYENQITSKREKEKEIIFINEEKVVFRFFFVIYKVRFIRK